MLLRSQIDHDRFNDVTQEEVSIQIEQIFEKHEMKEQVFVDESQITICVGSD